MSEPPPDPKVLDEQFVVEDDDPEGDESDEYEFEDGDEEGEDSDEGDEDYEEEAEEADGGGSLTALLLPGGSKDVNGTVDDPTEDADEDALDDEDDEEFVPDVEEELDSKVPSTLETKKRKIEADDEDEAQTEITTKKAKESEV